MAKATRARVRHGVDPAAFLMLDLQDDPASSWGDWLSYPDELEPGLRTINWAGEGKRLTVDKLVMAERLLEAGIAAPHIHAVVGRDRRAHPHEGRFPALDGVDAVVEAMAAWPDKLFVKPADGWRGDGIFGPERAESGWVVDGQAQSDRQLAERLVREASGAGLLVQERLASDPALHPIGGHLGMGTVRINTALTSNGPEIVFAFAKVMGSKGLVDNFSGGKFGNMLARVDTSKGRLTEVFGREAGRKYLMSRVERHPVTGTPLNGFPLPRWDEAVSLAFATARAFPEAPLIGSDVAITDRGPVIIEVQSDWDANAAQLVMERGLRPVLRDLLPRLALPDPLKKEAAEEFGLQRDRSVRRRLPREDRA